MIEVYVKVLLDGGEGCAMLQIIRELEKHLAGDSFYVRAENGIVRSVVIDEAEVGDFVPLASAADEEPEP